MTNCLSATIRWYELMGLIATPGDGRPSRARQGSVHGRRWDAILSEV